MTEDPLVRWVQANPYTILVDEAEDAWHAGNVRDVLQLDTGGLLVATESGGVWEVPSGASSLPLSDSWDHPDTNCLALGPDGPRHVYAGTEDGFLWETDLSQPVPLLSWNKVVGLPATGPIYGIAIVSLHRWIVLACANGIFWSQIPPAPGGAYAWKPAIDDPSLPAGAGYFGLTLTSTDLNAGEGWHENLSSLAVVAGGMGRDQNPGGIFIGQWKTIQRFQSRSTDLVMKRTVLHDDAGHDISLAQLAMGPVSVASGDAVPFVVYALCSAKDSTLMLIARSADGGNTFQMRGTKMQNSGKDLVQLVGNHGGDRNNCIAVARWNADYIAIGWQHGPFVSMSGGLTWLSVEPDTPHTHDDLHALCFAEGPPALNVEHRLYVASDGGVAMTNDLATLKRTSFTSIFNRELRNLQCSMPTGARGFVGNMTVSATEAGLVACGLQDNSNVYSVFGQNSTPWKPIDAEGDGGFTLLVSKTLAHSIASFSARLSTWNGLSFDDGGVIPLRVPGPTGRPATAGITPRPGSAPLKPFNWPGAPGIIGVAAAGSDVFGLCMRLPALAPEWRWLAGAPLTGGAMITSLAAVHSGTIFAGSSDGQIFAFDAGGVYTLPIRLSPPTIQSRKVGSGNVACLTAVDDSFAFAAVNGVVWSDQSTTVKRNYVVGLNGLKWEERDAGLPSDEDFYALAGDWTSSDPAIFVATDWKVYSSRDAGRNWTSASQGLPIRPHCADLRFVREPRGDYVYLSTWGRSVWVARLNADVLLEPFPDG